MKRNLGLSSLLAILILLMVSCNRLPGDISVLSATPDNQAPKQGQTVKVTVKIERLNGYNQPLTVKLEPAPDGVSAPNGIIAAGGDTTVMDVTFSKAGTFDLNFRATGDGITQVREKLIQMTATQAEDFTLELTPGILDIEPGKSGKTLNVKVARNAVMTQAINVAVSGLPANVSVSPATLVIPAGTGTQNGTFTVTAAANAAITALKDVTVTATGQGGQNVTKTGTFKLNVTQSADFTLAFDPANFSSLVVGQGGTGTVKVKVTRNSTHNEAITLSLDGLPAKVTAEPASINIPAGQTDGTLTVKVAPDAAAVTGASVSVKAVGQGVTKTLPFALTISTVAPEITSITLSPDPLTVSREGNNTLNVTVVRNPTLTGPITVSVATAGANALPTGVTAPNITIPAGSNDGVLTISANATATLVTNAAVAVTATSGAATRSKNFALTVQPGPGFSLATSVPEITILKGNNGNVTVTLSRDAGFTADVALTLEGAPTGVTSTFTPATLTNAGGATSTLNLVVANSVVSNPNGFTLTIKGTSGAKTVTKTIKLIVPELVISAANLTIVRGIPQTLTVNVTATALSAPVQIVLSGLPTGVTTTAPSNTITVAAGATSGTFSLTAAEGMQLGTPGPLGEQFAKKLDQNLTLTATTSAPAPVLNRTANLVLTVKPQFELEVYKGVVPNVGTCVEANPINSFALSPGGGIFNDTAVTPESQWICVKVIRNGSYNKNVYFEYKFEGSVLWVGQAGVGAPAGLGFAGGAPGGESDTAKPRIYLFLKHNQGAPTKDYFIRGIEVTTPDSGSYNTNVFIDVPLKFVLNP